MGNGPDPAPVVATYLDGAHSAVELVGRCDVAAAWERPSVLPGYTIGALAGHLGRSITNVATYLARPAPIDAEVVDAATYFASVLSDHDPVDSDFPRAVRHRSAEASAGGPAASP